MTGPTSAAPGPASPAPRSDPAPPGNAPGNACSDAPRHAPGRRHGRTGHRPTGHRPTGPALLLAVVYGIFAISATARSGVQILRDFEAAPVAYALSGLAALTYIAATVLIVRGARRGLLVLVVLELIGVLVVGTLSLVDPVLFPDETVWSGFGSGYGYVPLALPVCALAWLLVSWLRTRDSRPIS